MSILEYSEEIKGFYKSLNSRDIFVVLIIILTGTAAFAAGRLSIFGEKISTITLEQNLEGKEQGIEIYVASKTGTVYYFPWCARALSIKEENKVWFDSRALAESAGYRAAGNCRGL